MSADLTGIDVRMITQHFRPVEIGSAPYCTAMAEWLSEQGARVQVLTSRPYYPDTAVRPEFKDGSRDRETSGHLSIRRLKPFVPRRGRVIERLVADMVFLMCAVRDVMAGSIARGSVTVSFSPSIFTTIVGWIATPRDGRHIAIVHDIQSGLAEGLGFSGAYLFVKPLRVLERLALNRADTVVVLSLEMGHQLKKLGVTRPIVELPIWVDPQLIQPLPDDPSRAPTVLYSGNLGRKQGLSMVLDLAEQVGRLRSDVRILVRGVGYESDSLLAEARTRGLVNVSFLPLVPREKLGESLAEGDVHLVPQEPGAADFALPSKLYSIMAAGRPAVATARPGSSLWRMARETGAFVCVAPGDVAAFAAATLDLLDQPDKRRRLGEAGRRYAEQTAARDIVLGAYANLIRDGLIRGGC